MYTVHDWSEVRRLERAGLSKNHIARRLGMSRTTVRRLLALAEAPRYARPKASSLLDPHVLSIRAMLAEDHAVPATVILEHLREEGYPGGITILKALLQELRPHFAPPPDPLSRTTYVPGDILQIDWWDVPRIRVPVGCGHSRAAFGLVGVLPYSSAHAAVFTHTKTAADVVLALPGVLGRLSGLPRAVVVDRDSSIVNTKTGRVHDELAALLGHLAIRPIVLPPYRPRSKGAVERANGYLETSFVPLRAVSSLDDLQAQHDRWAREVAWRRVHRRVGTRPETALATERARMATLPSVWPDTSAKLFARASRDSFVRAAGIDYSVPPAFASRAVTVTLSLTEVTIFCEGREVAHHARSFIPADVVTAEGHAEELARAKAAHAALRRGDVALGAPDLALYDALVGVV